MSYRFSTYALKSGGELRESMRTWAVRGWVAWVALYAAATIATFFAAPFLLDGVVRNPTTWIAFAALLGGLVYLPVAVRSDRMGRAIVASSTAIIAMVALVKSALSYLCAKGCDHGMCAPS